MLLTHFASIPSQSFRLPGWNYGKKITIPASQIDADLTDFPISVYLNENNVTFSDFNSDGSDVRFTDGNLNYLTFEKKEWLSTTVTPNYGDGSNNGTSNAYTDSLYTSSGVSTTKQTYCYGNYYNLRDLYVNRLISPTYTVLANVLSVASGTNTIQLTTAADANKWIIILIAGGNTTSHSIEAFKIKVGSSYYNLSECVSNGYIEPLVLYSSSSNLGTEYAYTDCTDIYNGGTIGPGNYASVYISFKLKQTMTHIQFISDTTYNGSDGVTIHQYEPDGSSGEISLSSFNKPIGIFNVNIPSISATTDTIIYMWYGNSSAYNASVEGWKDQTGIIWNFFSNHTRLRELGDYAIFDGNGDALTLDGSSDFAFGTGDFCIEVNFYHTESGFGMLYDSRPTSDNSATYPVFFINSSNKLAYDIGNGTDPLVGSTTIEQNTLYKAAVVKSSGITKIYLNGTDDSVAPYSDSITYINGTSRPSIGRSGYWDGDEFAGRIYAIRVTKGSARYTTTYTPTTSFTVDSTNVKLCMNFNEPIDWLTFVDECNHKVTTVGGVIIGGLKSPIKRVLALDSGGGSYTTNMELDGSTNFAFGTGDFCVEFTFMTNSASNSIDYLYSSIVYGGPNGSYIHLFKGTDGYIKLAINDITKITGTTVIQSSIKYHIALVRVSGTTKLYINGIQEGSDYTDSNNYINSTARPILGDEPIYLGKKSTLIYYGLRINKGSGRYTSTFTPPTSYSIDSTDVVFCSNFDLAYDGNYITILHLNNDTRRIDGDCAYGLSTTGTPKKIPTALGITTFFYAASQMIDIYDYNQYTLTNNITMSIMAKKILTGGTDLLCYLGASGTDGFGIHTHALYFALKSGSSFADTTQLITNTIQNVTIKRTSGTWSMFVDGTSYSITNLSVTTTDAANDYISIGKTYTGTPDEQFDGILANFRFSNTARSDAWIKAESLTLLDNLITISNV